MALSQYPFKGGIPTGTTAQRPSSPAIGDVFYNGDLGLLEIYTSAGWQPSSAPSGTPAIVVTDLGTSRAYTDGPAFKIDFTASNLGGFPVGYTVTATSTVTSSVYSGSTSTGTTITVATFSSSTGYGATYTVSGASYNGFGASPYANGSVTVTTKPQAPTIGAATTNYNTTDITVTWTNGANGGLPLSSIKVRAYSGATLISTTTAATTSSTSATITGLTQDSAYTFKVFATNANGDSPETSASNSVTVPGAISVNSLVVAGGAGGGYDRGPGGGAGGLIDMSSVSLTLYKTSVYTLTVGGGGAGAAGESGNGSNSVFATLTAIGGGGSSGPNGNGKSGGSGGGAGWTNGNVGGSGTQPSQSGNSGTYGYGNSGGDGATGAVGGGGGAGGAGVKSVGTSTRPNGGAARSVSITGSAVYYAGGGGAGKAQDGGPYYLEGYGGNTTTTANKGGGADGASSAGGIGGAGTANTGGGGGGGSNSGAAIGGSGGSGIVIIKIPSTNSATFSGGVTSSLSTSVTGYKIYSITAAGTNDTVTFS
jgi:hypothetical protein